MDHHYSLDCPVLSVVVFVEVVFVAVDVFVAAVGDVAVVSSATDECRMVYQRGPCCARSGWGSSTEPKLSSGGLKRLKCWSSL